MVDASYVIRSMNNNSGPFSPFFYTRISGYIRSRDIMSGFGGNQNEIFYNASNQNVADLATRIRLSLIQSISDQKQVSDHMYGNKSAILSKFPKGTCKAVVGIKHNTNGLTGAEVVFIGNSIQPTKHLSAANGGNATMCIRF